MQLVDDSGEPLEVQAHLTNALVIHFYTAGMARRAKHVVPHNGGWIIRSEGYPAAKNAKLYSSKRDAVIDARSAAKKYRTVLVIHGRDGRIQDVDTYEAAPTRRELLPG